MKEIKREKLEVQRKYKIQELLDNMTKRDHDRILKIIPKEIGRCKSSFMQYKNIPMGAKEEMPYSVGIKLEKIFELAPGTLHNDEISCPSYKELLKKN